ncbi:dehydrin ERD10-like [Prosopis cineraria]|uniref:dehydrin ERD10-like n=1 Tax=Prosopis cineraria TaxID=364024 RepID=UPI00240FA737|nr:dehydrin ERD10-like [Prosopis cineraria]
MGGCGSKSRVLKEIGQPNNEVNMSESHEAHHHHHHHHQLSSPHEISSKRPSLSYLFHQSEGMKTNTRSEKSEDGENVKKEASEKEKQKYEGKELNERNEGGRQESLPEEAKNKFSEETQSSN